MPYKNKQQEKEWFQNRYQNNKDKLKLQVSLLNKEYPERAKNRALKRNYGITLDEWQSMWDEQDGKCAICGKYFIKPRDAHVDHNHETGEIRGLLCRMCNVGLGHFNEDKELLFKVIEYLGV